MKVPGVILVFALAFALSVRRAMAESQDKPTQEAKIDRAQAEAITTKHASVRQSGGCGIEVRECSTCVVVRLREGRNQGNHRSLVNAAYGKVHNVSTENPSDETKEKAADQARLQHR